MAGKNTEAKLTDKQKKFCDEYLIDLNATQAAIRAGYSKKTAQEIGSENLSKPIIQKYIQERQKALQEKTEITQERVLQEYARLAFFDIRNVYDDNGRLLNPKEMDDDTAAAVAGIDVYEDILQMKGISIKMGETKKVKLHSKPSALQDLAKHLGLFKVDNEQKAPRIESVTIKRKS